MITIRVKTKSGQVQQFQVEEIIEIDGRPYVVSAPTQELAERVARLEGIAEALMSAVFETEETAAADSE